MLPEIVSVTIAGDPTFGDEPKQVTATFDDDTTEVLFSYYSDELSFTESEFVGKTALEARELHYQRDMEWLRS